MGRDGRRWTNPPDGCDALMMSVALPGPLPVGVLERLPADIADIACAALAAHGADVQTDLPNDLVSGGRKLGGVLIDARTQGDEVAALVIGVGINLGGDPFDVDGVAATTAAAAGAHDVDREQLAAQLAEAISERVYA
jgi:biotin-(acetyl-CoA carboxylase) ligase